MRRSSRREASALGARVVAFLARNEDQSAQEVADALGVSFDRARTSLRYLELCGVARSYLIRYQDLPSPPPKGGRDRRYYALAEIAQAAE